MKKVNIKTLHGKQLFELNIIENGKYFKSEILCFSFIGKMIKYSAGVNMPGIIKLGIFDEFYFDNKKKY